VKNGAMISPLPYLPAITDDTSLLLEALATSSSQDVPTCPGWTVARLAGHVGRVHRMAARIVSLGLLAPPAADDLPPVPEGVDDIASYLRDGSAELHSVLTTTALGSPAWNMIGEPYVAGFWPRRIAHETAIHRVDAQFGSGTTPTAIATDLAIDGIDEFFDLMPARVLNKQPTASLGGSLHLHATDGPGEWMIEIESGVLHLSHGHGKGSAAVRGTASDLLLGVWGRLPFESNQFDCFGDADVRQRFADLGAF
jgi:uncharacterized protein (TIGR03083 family)